MRGLATNSWMLSDGLEMRKVEDHFPTPHRVAFVEVSSQFLLIGTVESRGFFGFFFRDVPSRAAPKKFGHKNCQILRSSIKKSREVLLYMGMREAPVVREWQQPKFRVVTLPPVI